MAIDEKQLAVQLGHDGVKILTPGERFHWRTLGEGTYNQVSRSKRRWCIVNDNQQAVFYGRLVFKQALPQVDDGRGKSTSLTNSQIACNQARNAPARFIAKWQQHNPAYPVAAYRGGAVVPYLGRREATDRQIADKVFAIYRQHGDIVVDAASPNNFLVFNGETVCVDFDVAYHKQEDSNLELHNDFYNGIFNDYWQRCFNYGYKKTIGVIRALVLLDDLRDKNPVVETYLSTATRDDLIELDRTVCRMQRGPKGQNILARTAEVIRAVLLPLKKAVLTDNPRHCLEKHYTLRFAAYYGMQQQMKECLTLGVDINHQDEIGDTALMAAVQGNQKNTLLWLLRETKPDYRLKNISGKTALDLAKGTGCEHALRCYVARMLGEERRMAVSKHALLAAPGVGLFAAGACTLAPRAEKAGDEYPALS